MSFAGCGRNGVFLRQVPTGVTVWAFEWQETRRKIISCLQRTQLSSRIITLLRKLPSWGLA